MRLAALLTLLLAFSSALAQSDPAALQWLQRIYSATRNLSYSGTFVYHHGQQVEASRITRFVDASGPVEKLETLAGTPREIIRSRDQVVCYMPDVMTVKIDKNVPPGDFPGVLSGQFKDIADHYVVRRGEAERVAGYDCEVVVLQPRDQLRYGHRLWADRGTAMLLKTVTLNERNEMLELFAFTQLQIGGGIDRDRVRSRFSGMEKVWRVEDSAGMEANLAGAGWTIRSQLPGFRKIMEMTRTLGGKAGIGHIVLSDGLAAVSVFIEPVAKEVHRAGLSRQGAINVYGRELADHWITVLGEAPAESVRSIANGVEFRRPVP